MEEEDEETRPHIIIDNGAGYCKAGLSGEIGPRAVFPSCVGYPKYASGMVGGEKKEFFVGADAEAKRGVLKLHYPIENGVVNNWDDMEKIWGHIFTNELRVDPIEHNVMLTEAIMNPKENREKMAQIMFETFKVPGLYIANQGPLSLYSAGKFTGFVVESGESVTQFIPIFDGYCLPHAINRFDFGGKALTIFLMLLLTETGQRFSTTAEREIVKGIKEKACYVALDFQDEIRSVEPFDYELPDGTHVVVKDQRIRCSESIFNPNTLYYCKDIETFLKPSIIPEKGLGEACYESIQKCEIDLRKDFYNCIVLSGGNSMFKGLPERLTKEIKALVFDSMKEEVKVIASPERRFAVWIGGDILSSISSFKSNWITKTEYEESGAYIVHRKCF